VSIKPVTGGTMHTIVVGAAAIALLIGAVWLTRHVIDGGAESAPGAVLGQGLPASGERFEAFGYRTSSRFGSTIDIVIADEHVHIQGPRVPRAVYYLFIGGQCLIGAALFTVLAASLAYLHWQWLGWALLALFAHYLVGSLGAAAFWELPRMTAMSSAKLPSISFPVSAMRDVRVGKGWSRRGLGIVILPFTKAIDSMADDCISFDAPDGTTPRDVVYALHFPDADEVERFLTALDG
jgi:hypothetical protein